MQSARGREAKLGGLIMIPPKSLHAHKINTRCQIGTRSVGAKPNSPSLQLAQPFLHHSISLFILNCFSFEALFIMGVFGPLHLLFESSEITEKKLKLVEIVSDTFIIFNQSWDFVHGVSTD